jgi:hypothetical protein
MQNKLSEVYLYIELDEKNARKLERKIFEKLSELNFYCSLRVEGYAFFLNKISETIGLPNIRLIISKNILITRIHMIPGLIEEKALAIGLTSQEVYSKIMHAIDEVSNLYNEYGKTAISLIINK